MSLPKEGIRIILYKLQNGLETSLETAVEMDLETDLGYFHTSKWHKKRVACVYACRCVQLWRGPPGEGLTSPSPQFKDLMLRWCLLPPTPSVLNSLVVIIHPIKILQCPLKSFEEALNTWFHCLYPPLSFYTLVSTVLILINPCRNSFFRGEVFKNFKKMAKRG